MRSWALRVRRSTGLSPRASVAADKEPLYVESVKRIQREIDAGRFAVAKRGAVALSRDFPGTSGGLVLLCALSFHEGKVMRARGECAQALQVYDEDVNGRYVLAVTMLSQGARSEAAVQLERVLELDPQHQDARSTLASLRR